jgi:glycosyltransferase involved in cell wall biosynthesis
MFTPTSDGGHARYTWELLNALAQAASAGAGGVLRQPHRFELVTSRDLHPQFDSDHYRIHRILPPLRDRSEFPTRLSWAASRATHYARREWQFLRWLGGRPDIDAVHFQEWTPWLAAPLFRRLRALGKRVFYTVHNIVPHRYPRAVPRAVMNGWIRRACLLCDGLFVHTDLLAEELAQFLGARESGVALPPIHVVPHGVWTMPDVMPRATVDERLALKRLLFFGEIRRNKGLDLLLRAMVHLPAGYSLTIAGEPRERDYFREEILPLVAEARRRGATIDLRDRFTPECEVPALFAGHSAVVLPYTPKFVAQSGVVFMALAHDTPVVASEAGGLRELFEEFRIGATFREATPEALASAVRAVCEQGAAGEIAREIRAAKQRFSWRQAALATLAGYATAFETQGQRAPHASCAVPQAVGT